METGRVKIRGRPSVCLQHRLFTVAGVMVALGLWHAYRRSNRPFHLKAVRRTGSLDKRSDESFDRMPCGRLRDVALHTASADWSRSQAGLTSRLRHPWTIIQLALDPQYGAEADRADDMRRMRETCERMNSDLHQCHQANRWSWQVLPSECGIRSSTIATHRKTVASCAPWAAQ